MLIHNYLIVEHQLVAIFALKILLQQYYDLKLTQVDKGVLCLFVIFVIKIQSTD